MYSGQQHDTSLVTDTHRTLPAIPDRDTSTLEAIITGKAAPLIGRTVLRLDCLPALQILASVEHELITLRNSHPQAVRDALSSLEQVGTFTARCEYDLALSALNAHTIDPLILPETGKPRATLELLRARLALDAKQCDRLDSLTIAEGALTRLQQCTPQGTQQDIFQAETLVAILSATRAKGAPLEPRQDWGKRLEYLRTAVDNFGSAATTFLQLSDHDKLGSIGYCKELVLALLDTYPSAQKDLRSAILHQLHDAISSPGLDTHASPEQRFQLELTLLSMAHSSADLLFKAWGSDPGKFNGVSALGQKVIESCRHELGKPAPVLAPSFSDMQRVAKLCYDYRQFQMAYAITDHLCGTAGLNRLQQRDTLLESSCLRLLVVPEVVLETSDAEPLHPDLVLLMRRIPQRSTPTGLKEIRDVARRSFHGDQDALDRLEIAFGTAIREVALKLPLPGSTIDDLPTDTHSMPYPLSQIGPQIMTLKEIVRRKGVSEVVKQEASLLLEDLNDILEENAPLSFD